MNRTFRGVAYVSVWVVIWGTVASLMDWMLLTGEVDRRTPISETEQFYQALKLRGVDAAKDAKEDFVEKCAAQTAALRDCMIANPGYYGDMLEGAGEDDDGDDQLDDQLDDPIDGEKEEEGEPKQGKKQASAS